MVRMQGALYPQRWGREKGFVPNDRQRDGRILQRARALPCGTAYQKPVDGQGGDCGPWISVGPGPLGAVLLVGIVWVWSLLFHLLGTAPSKSTEARVTGEEGVPLHEGCGPCTRLEPTLLRRRDAPELLERFLKSQGLGDDITETETETEGNEQSDVDGDDNQLKDDEDEDGIEDNEDEDGVEDDDDEDDE
ncbi:hypothetical protein B0H14DRAFT_2588947 [Mycena olivaceomarginata]|nr:hypothetical protein B0H14DRAFT_2588947 [Mycena olivaceomarginata]